MRRQSSIQRVMIKMVDTDVVVLAVALFSELKLNKLWIDFGSGQNQSYFPVHAISNSLGAEKSKVLLMFHAFTRRDQTLFFASRRKINASSTWHNFDEVTETFVKLSSSPKIKAATDAMPVLDRFVVLMYDRTSNCLDVNSCRRDLGLKRGKQWKPSRRHLPHFFTTAFVLLTKLKMSRANP